MGRICTLHKLEGKNSMWIFVHDLYKDQSAKYSRLSKKLCPLLNELVKRFNKNLKGISFIFWAYREITNRTTGVAPFQLLFGRNQKVDCQF